MTVDNNHSLQQVNAGTAQPAAAQHPQNPALAFPLFQKAGIYVGHIDEGQAEKEDDDEKFHKQVAVFRPFCRQGHRFDVKNMRMVSVKCCS